MDSHSITLFYKKFSLKIGAWALTITETQATRTKQICKLANTTEVVARISLLNKLEVMFRGRSFLFWAKKEGWHRSLPIYLFLCPNHGYVSSQLIGEYERLACPHCNYILEC